MLRLRWQCSVMEVLPRQCSLMRCLPRQCALMCVVLMVWLRKTIGVLLTTTRSLTPCYVDATMPHCDTTLNPRSEAACALALGSLGRRCAMLAEASPLLVTAKMSQASPCQCWRMVLTVQTHWTEAPHGEGAAPQQCKAQFPQNAYRESVPDKLSSPCFL